MNKQKRLEKKNSARFDRNELKFTRHYLSNHGRKHSNNYKRMHGGHATRWIYLRNAILDEFRAKGKEDV